MKFSNLALQEIVGATDDKVVADRKVIEALVCDVAKLKY